MTRWLLLGQTIQQLWEIWLQSLAEQPTWGQHFLIFFSPVIFPIWGENSGSEKSKKFSSESGFPPCIDLWNSSICSNVLHTLLHTLLAADKRTPPHHLWDLLLKIDEFLKKCSGGKQLSGMNFLDFLIPKNSPWYGELRGEKISKFRKVVLFALRAKHIFYRIFTESGGAHH